MTTIYSCQCYIQLIDRYETDKEKEAVDKRINSSLQLIVASIYYTDIVIEIDLNYNQPLIFFLHHLLTWSLTMYFLITQRHRGSLF